MLYIIVGLPATGKTEAAKMLADKTGASILNEDDILRELFPEPTHSREERQEVYDEMFRRARELLKFGEKVILDATFISKANRDKARGLSEDYKIIEVTAPEDQIKKRLEKRCHKSDNDADWGVYLKYKKNFEPVFEHHPALDNSKSLEKVQQQLEKILNE